MKLSIAFLFPVLILTACGQPVYQAKYSITVASEYVESFKVEAIANGRNLASVEHNLIIKLGHLPPGELGVCKQTAGQNMIVLSVDWWSLLPALEQQELVWHELGHCWLNRGHTNARLADDSPISIMNTYHFDAQTYWAHYDYYNAELFGN